MLEVARSYIKSNTSSGETDKASSSPPVAQESN